MVFLFMKKGVENFFDCKRNLINEKCGLEHFYCIIYSIIAIFFLIFHALKAVELKGSL